MHILCTSVLLAVTYIPYILIKIPPNLVLKRPVSGRCFLACVSCGEQFRHLSSWCRTTQACLLATSSSVCAKEVSFPVLYFFLSDFYRRHELQTRIGMHVWSSISERYILWPSRRRHRTPRWKGNLAGWRWVFLLEHCLRHLRTLVVTQHSLAGSLV
jgi:hypothetical protein